MTYALIEEQKILSVGKIKYISNENQIIIEVKNWPYGKDRKLRKDEVYYDGKEIIAKTQTMLDEENEERIKKERINKFFNSIYEELNNCSDFDSFKQKMNKYIGG